MNKILGFLVFIGLIVWGFFLAEEYMPETKMGKMLFDDAITAERCKQFGYGVEGERILDYRDRIKQVIQGCW